MPVLLAASIALALLGLSGAAAWMLCGPLGFCVAPDLFELADRLSGLWAGLELPAPGWLRPLLILLWVVLFAFVMPAVYGLVQDRLLRRRGGSVPSQRAPR
jgi:hypothetical protein